MHRITLIRVLGEVGIADPPCIPEVPSTLRERALTEESNHDLRALGEVVAAAVHNERGAVEALISLLRGTDDAFSLSHETTCALGELMAADPLQATDALKPFVVRVRRTEGDTHARAVRALGEMVAINPTNADAAVTALVERVTRGERSSEMRSDHWWTAMVLGEVVLADPNRFDDVPDALIERIATSTAPGEDLAVGTLGELAAAAEGTDMEVIDCFVERARMSANEPRRYVFHFLGVAVATMSAKMEIVPDQLKDRVMQIHGDRWWWSASVLGEIVAAHRYDTDRALETLADRLRATHGSTRMRCAQAIGEIVSTSPHSLNSQTAQFAEKAQAAQGEQRSRWLRLTGHIHVRSYPGTVQHLCRSLAVSDGDHQEESLKALLALAHTEEVTPQCFLKNATAAVGEELSELVNLTPYLSLKQKPRHRFLIVVREFLSTATSERQFPELRTQLRSFLTSDDKVATPTRLLITDILTHLEGELNQSS